MKGIVSLMLAMTLLVLSTNPVNATPYRIDFVFDQFDSIIPNGESAPYDLITGSISYDADGVDRAWNQLLAIDLMIGTHEYRMEEALISDAGVEMYVYADMGNGHEMVRGTDDFFIAVGYLGGPLFNGMAYTTAGVEGSWNTMSARVFELSEISGAPVPEPTTMFLFGSGLVGLVGFRKKFKK